VSDGKLERSYWDGFVGRDLTDGEWSWVARWLRVYGMGNTEQAIDEAAKRGKDMNTRYVSGMLRKWREQGSVTR